MYKELVMLLNESAKDEQVLAFALTGNGTFFSSGNDMQDSFMKEDPSAAINTITLLYK